MATTPQFSDKYLSQVMPRIIEFVDQLLLFKPGCVPLKLFKGVCDRCLAANKKKVDPAKIILLFRSFADHCLPFLASGSALRMLDVDYCLEYIPDKIYIPLGDIMKKADVENRETLREHLLGICKLVAGPSTKVDKINSLLSVLSPDIEDDDDDEEFKLDEADKSFLAPVLSGMPGVDPKMLLKVGKKAFGNIDASKMTPEELQQTVLDGVGSMMETPFFKQVFSNMNKVAVEAAESGKTEEHNFAQYQEMIMMGQNMMMEAKRRNEEEIKKTE